MTIKEMILANAKKIIASINPGTADISDIGDGTIKGAVRYLNSISMKELLWKNASPTSQFNPQTLSLNVNLKQYDIIKVVYCYDNTNPDFMGAVGGSIDVPNSDVTTHHLMEVNGFFRTFNVNETSLYFSDGYKGGTSSALNNKVVVPLYIYGIKGVKV